MIELTEQPLDAERVTAQVRRDTNGAVVTFLGTTRDNFEGKRVVTLEYEGFSRDGRQKAGRDYASSSGPSSASMISPSPTGLVRCLSER